MPVIRLKSVVLPAPFGPMIALRSPGMIRRSTPRTACRPPNRFDSPLSSSTGVAPLACGSMMGSSRANPSETSLRAKRSNPESRHRPLDCFVAALLAMTERGGLLARFAGRELPAVDRLLEELGLVVASELADVRIGLDHRVPELGLVVAEH